jgi:hypothetical protein
MTKIRTYEDLLLEKHRLKLLLHAQKEQVHQDFREIKEEFEPVKSALSVVTKLFKKEPGNLLLTGTANTIIDLLLKKFILARTGWFTRIVVPFFAKNYASHFISEKKDTIIQKLASLFSRKKHAGNGQMHHVDDDE